MARKNWNRWFFASRRGQIITLLRRSSRTVDELAQVLGLTHTAVRAHLAALERDGLVQQRSERRGGGKPSLVYDLTPAAEYLFPKSYAQLLDVLQGRMTTEEIKTLLREIGRRMAAEWKHPPGNLRVRLEAAVEVLNELGSLMERETEGGALCIRGYRCPFRNTAHELVQSHVASSYPRASGSFLHHEGGEMPFSRSSVLEWTGASCSNV